jgi:hypothetical protein
LGDSEWVGGISKQSYISSIKELQKAIFILLLGWTPEVLEHNCKMILVFLIGFFKPDQQQTFSPSM